MQISLKSFLLVAFCKVSNSSPAQVAEQIQPGLAR